MKQLFKNFKLCKKDIPVVMVICIGVFLSILMFGIVRNREIQNIKADFNQAAWNGINSIEREIETHVEALQSVYKLFKNSHDVTRKDFHTFCNSYILSHRGIQAIEWIPRVSYSLRQLYENAAQIDGHPAFQITKRNIQGKIDRADERKEYFPVYYVEPYRGNEIALGFDLATDPMLLGALDKSRDTGEIVAIARNVQLQERRDQYGLLVFLPVYYNQAQTNMVSERRENLIGFVLGVLRIGELVKESLSYLKDKDVKFYLYDVSGPQKEQFLTTHLKRIINDGSLTVLQQEMDKDKLQVFHTFNVADRKWSVQCKPVPKFIADRTTWHPWGFLVGGLLFSGLIVAYLRNTTDRSIQIGRLESELSTETVERRQNEEALRENEERFHSLVESSIDGILAYDMDFRCTLWNRVMEQTSGIRSEELTGRKVFETLPFLEEAANSFKDTLKGNPTIQPTMPYNFPDTGKSGYFESSHFPLFNAQGQIIGGMVIIKDVTEKILMEEALQESEEKTRKLIDTTQDAVICVDGSGIINGWGQAAERIFGYSKSEIFGQPVTTIIPEKYQEAHMNGLEAFLQTGKTRIIGKTIEVSGKTKNGREVPIEISLSFQTMGKEQYTFIAAIRDITFQKEAKKQLIEKSKELESINEELNDFVDFVSRDLKGPLVAIEDYGARLSKLDKDTFDEEGKRYIKSIMANIETMSKRTFEIMKVMEVGTVAYNFKNNDIGSMVKDVVNTLESKIETNKINLLIQHNLPDILCDEDRMRDVFLNLITNAIKFMGDCNQREIKIGCEQDGDNYRFIVEDTGIGIEEEHQDGIFKIFTRLKDLDAEGSGVGLTIVKKIVEIHKGRVWVESPVENGRGARFCFTIPVMS